MKKIILILMMLVLMLQVSIAEVRFTSSNRVANEDNVELYFSSSSGSYGLELSIPPNFLIVSDPSGGIIADDGLYRTFYSGDLVLTLRAPQKHDIYYINGKYTVGDEIKDLPQHKIIVYNSVRTQVTCPVCPKDSKWSVCSNELQSKLTYTCSQSTSFVCVRKIESQKCVIDEDSCKQGWFCIDDKKLGLSDNECNYDSIIECKNGCDLDKNVCKSDSLLDLAKEKTDNGKLKVFKFFENIIDWLKELFNNSEL